jgi:hypothetical protein
MKALGVQAAEDAINNLVSGPLEEARKSLKTIDVHSIEDTVTVICLLACAHKVLHRNRHCAWNTVLTEA